MMSQRGRPKKPRKPTFSEIVRDVEALPKAAQGRALRPGRVNADGVLASPDGEAFLLEAGDIDPTTAQELVRGGAIIAEDACGCGGGYCSPIWSSSRESLRLAASPPRRTKGSAPTWIDHWAGPVGAVVFLHGDYRWMPQV